MQKILDYLMARGTEGSSWTAVGAGMLVTYYNLSPELLPAVWDWVLQGAGYAALLAGIFTGDKGAKE